MTPHTKRLMIIAALFGMAGICIWRGNSPSAYIAAIMVLLGLGDGDRL